MQLVRNHRFGTGFLLGSAGVLSVGALWFALSSPPPAYGQIPDAGAQRNEVIQELRTNNRTLTEIAGLLRDIRDDARKNAAKDKPHRPESEPQPAPQPPSQPPPQRP